MQESGRRELSDDEDGRDGDGDDGGDGRGGSASSPTRSYTGRPYCPQSRPECFAYFCFRTTDPELLTTNKAIIGRLLSL